MKTLQEKREAARQYLKNLTDEQVLWFAVNVSEIDPKVFHREDYEDYMSDEEVTAIYKHAFPE